MKLTVMDFKDDYTDAIKGTSARQLEDTTPLERYNALGELLKDYIGNIWANTNKTYRTENSKQV